MEDNWNGPFAGAASPRRWRALKLPPTVDWGGAPYLRQMPSGDTILSFQSPAGRKQHHMVVYVGDENARNFGGRTVPFEINSGAAGVWNSLFVKDERTITAISGCNGVIYAIDGHITSSRRYCRWSTAAGSVTSCSRNSPSASFAV